MYVEQVRIKDLRTIASASIDLCVPKRGSLSSTDGPLSNVTLLLGTNGVGKTSVLRAIAMSALAPLLPRSSGFVPKSMVRRTDDRTSKMAVTEADLLFTGQDATRVKRATGRVVLTPNARSFQDRFDDVPEIPSWAKPLWDDKSPALFLVGYGASRRVDSAGAFGAQVQERERNLRFHRVAGLFEESVVLRPLSSWLPHWDNAGRRKQFLGLLANVLPNVDLIDEMERGEHLFRVGPSSLPFDALSDGLRALIGWVTDLLYHVSRFAAPGSMLFETEGLVLVDEVDLHLHPAWQREIIPRLARAMPHLQFVFTSHSPMLVGSLHRENVRVLRAQGGCTVIEPAQVEVHGLSADQILTSEYFGLDTAREPAFAERLQKVAADARAGDANKAQQFLRMLTLGSAGARDGESSKAIAKKATPRKKATSRKAPSKNIASKKAAPKKATPKKATPKKARRTLGKKEAT